MTDITNLDDAKALKAMGVPLNTPVTHVALPKEQDRQIRDTLKVAIACRAAVFNYVEKPDSYRAMKRLCKWHEKLGTELEKIRAPLWKRNDDGSEELLNGADLVVAAIIEPRCVKAWEMWNYIIEKLSNGEDVTMNCENGLWPTDIPEEQRA